MRACRKIFFFLLISVILINCNPESSEEELPALVIEEAVNQSLGQPAIQQPRQNSQSQIQKISDTPPVVPITPEEIPDTEAPLIAQLGEISVNSPHEVMAVVSDESTFTINWKQISGPGTVSFSASDSATTQISASQDGLYEIKLTATDTAGNISSDDFNLIWDTTAPAVTVNSDISSPALTHNVSASVIEANLATASWGLESGPEIVNFDTPFSENTLITMSGDGAAVIRFSATDKAGNLGFAELSIIRNSAAALVSSGIDTIAIAQAGLTGTVDDGTSVTYLWSQQSGPGTASFSAPSALNTNVSADVDGIYVLRLTADKGGIESYDEMVLTWDINDPIVGLGIDRSENAAFFPNPIATDTNPLAFAWTMESGPGSVVFSDSAVLNPTVSFDQDGIYTIRLTATDVAGHSGFDDSIITWDQTVPAVDVGADQVGQSTMILIDATTADFSSMAYQWSKVSGPGAVYFSAPTGEDTLTSMDVPGQYTLRLTATDSLGNSSWDELDFEWIKFSKIWNFSTSTDYAFDPLKIGFNAGVVSLIPIDNVDNIDTQAEFEPGTHTYSETEWDSGNAAISLNAAGLAAQAGSYTSEIINFGTTLDVNNLEWTSDIPGPYQRGLPGNGESDPVEWGVDSIQGMNGLILLFHFDEDAGSTNLVDSSGNLDSNSIPMETQCNGGECPILNYRGRIGRGVEFDGSDDYLTIPDDESNRISGDMSISLWMKVDSNDFNYIIEKGDSDACDNYGFLIYQKKAMFEFSDNMGDVDTCTGSWVGWGESDAAMVAGQWYHLAVVYDHDNGDITFYRNGAVSGQYLGITERLKPSNQDVRIGRQWWGGGNANAGFFDGGLDELAVFDRELSAVEITRIYERGLYRLDLQVRGCADGTCSADPAWLGPDGSSNSKFYTYVNSDNATISTLPVVGVTNTQFFQYKVQFTAPNTILSPLIDTIKISTFAQDNPSVSLGTGHKDYITITGFEELTESDHIGDVQYQVSPNGTDFYYFNGTNWTLGIDDYSNTNSASSVNSAISSFSADVGVGDFSFRAYLNKNPGSGFIRLNGVKLLGTQLNP